MKKNKLFKYLFGSLAGVVLAGAVIGGVVSCSNGSSNTSTTTSTNNVTSSTSSTPTPTANNTISDYALTDTYNTSTIAYKNAQTQNASEISMVATNSNVANYSTLANEPGNLAIYTNGSTTPTAVINSANATNTTTTTTLNLTLQKDSELYNEWENGKITNLNSLASQLGSLISFSPTEVTDYHLTINYPNSNYVSKLNYSTTNQPLNFYFTPNNAQWGASSASPLQAELSLAQNSTTNKDYVAFNILNSNGNVVNDLLNDSNCIFTSDIKINYEVNNKYYSDPITLNISLQPYFSTKNNYTVSTNGANLYTDVYVGTYTPNKSHTSVTTKGKGWMLVDAGSAYECYFDNAWYGVNEQGEWYSENAKGDITLLPPWTFSIMQTSSNSNQYQIMGDYYNPIILITPTGLVLNQLKFTSLITL